MMRFWRPAATAGLCSALLLSAAPVHGDGLDDAARKQAEAARILFRGSIGHRSAETRVFDALSRAMREKAGSDAAKNRELRSRLAQLRIEEDALQADEDALVRARHALRETIQSLRPREPQAFAVDDASRDAGTFDAWFNDQLSRRAEALGEWIETLSASIAERRAASHKLREALDLPPRTETMIDGIQLTALEYARFAETERRRAAPSTDRRHLDLKIKDKSVIFSTRYENGPAPIRGSLAPETRWMTGRLSFQGGGAASGNGGQEERIAIGTAWRMTKGLAAGMNLHVRNGTYAFDAQEQDVAYRGLGVTGGLRMRLGENLTANLLAYRHPTWTTTGGNHGDGAYFADPAGVVARLSGEKKLTDITLKPSFSMRYKWTRTDGYVDSAGVAVPEQSARGGAYTAALRVDRSFPLPPRAPGSRKLSTYLEFKYDRTMRRHEEMAFGGNTTVSAPYTRATTKLGAETKTARRARLKLYVYLTRRVDTDDRKAGTSARLDVKF